ncbi:hypothetical protein ACFQS1_07400 [Paractinoplanes rhizophilus]|uniref:Uncharacterized protein n=1 Tax=Paractinoplanes rhizophilus TaxID=1416877 RepID=A0ABW2HKT5_9ACTN
MITQADDALMWIAERVADCFSKSGYAFVEDDKVGPLAATLRTFLTVEGIPVNTINDQAIGDDDSANDKPAEAAAPEDHPR